MTILITGGAGYIGSHIVDTLVKNNYQCAVFDNLYRGNLSNVKVPVYVGDIRNINDIKKTFDGINKKNKIEAVLHLAALTSVPESMENKNEYLEVNSEGTMNLLTVMKDAGCNKLIFSSTASVYKQSNNPVNESDPIEILNNYALSKYFAEQIIKKQDWLDSVIFRYFNVIGYMAGYDKSVEIGKTNILPVLLDIARNKRIFHVYGNCYPVKRENPEDHTCVRDYIDVRDIANAHIKALSFLENSKGQTIFNLGTKHGTSVLELLDAFEKANNIKIDYKITGKRQGDPASVIANSTKANELLGWMPNYSLQQSLKII